MQYLAPLPVTSQGVDPLRTQQWHLQNAGQAGGTAGEDLNIAGAWTTTAGAGVRVVIVDNALETVHADLSANIEPKASFSYRSEQQGYPEPLPCFTSEGHGTSVAGIIAARGENAVGGAGVAPQAKLVGYNALATNTDADLADALNRDLQKNSIYNSSWGSNDDATLHPVSNLHTLALEQGLRAGRAGKGAIYVFAAGNGGCVRVAGDSASCQSDNTNFDGYLTHMAAIVVGAVDRFGRAPRYTEAGANLMVNAPGGDASLGITTTSIRDGYTQTFSGTSASTPMVSGVLALMLSVNPSLTWRDARLILAQSARKNDPTHASWRASAPAAGGQPAWFSHRYGFGTVDASAAVAAAAGWQSVGGSEQLLNCGPYDWTVESPISDTGSSLSTAISVSGAQCAITKIEYVTIRVDVQHDYSGDLSMTLASPNGTDSELATRRRCVNSGRDRDHCGSYNDWRFGSVRHMNEPVAGVWRLNIADLEAGLTGKLNRWSIQFHGR